LVFKKFSINIIIILGWASVQISNMAVVNSLSYSTQYFILISSLIIINRRRDRLISLRNGFTYVANFTVLTIALFYFAIME
jgi:hypothetical protein